MVHQVQPVQPVLSRPVAPVSLPGAAGTPVPHPVAPIPHLPASSVPRMASSGSQDAMKIPTISSPPRPRLPIQQNIGMRRPQVPMQYPPVSSRPMLVPQPPQMVRAPQFPGPPRPAGIVQPISASRGFPPSRPGGPVSYPRGMFHFLLSELGNMKQHKISNFFLQGSQQCVCVCVCLHNVKVKRKLLLRLDTNRCSGYEPVLLPRADGWMYDFAIVNYHQ